jgi:heavy metal translocating P-type ATPase
MAVSPTQIDERWWAMLRASREARIAVLTAVVLVLSLWLEHLGVLSATRTRTLLLVVVLVSGAPMLLTLARAVIAGRFGADLLAGMAIVTAVVAGQLVVAAIVIVMWTGGQALEQYANRRASRVLEALAARNPETAHRQVEDRIVDIPLAEIREGDVLVVLPHEVCPVDGYVRAGSSTMDESLISGEPYFVAKTGGVAVISGARNGEGALTIVAARRADESRFARIIALVRDAELQRPSMRRLADRLGAWYTPLALGVAAAAWAASGSAERFLAVLVIATPCPLLLGVPVALIGAVSAAAERSILIRDTSIFERIGECRTAIFDKTGTLTLGQPVLVDVVLTSAKWTRDELLALAASAEQYSKHPLAAAVLAAAGAAGAAPRPAAEIREAPGTGLTGRIDGREVVVTGRKHLAPQVAVTLPPTAESGLECIVVIDGEVAGLFRFADMPRADGASLVGHLEPRHRFTRLMLVSGDRESEVRHLGRLMGIPHVSFNQSPEQKIAIVRDEQQRQPTLFVGDGVNDAPAMVAADVAIAIGHRADAASEAAGAVILDGSLSRVDDLLHLAARTRRIALQSAVGGMALSVIGMGAAAVGWLPPIGGAFAQEAIDVWAVVNALRAAFPPAKLRDFDGPGIVRPAASGMALAKPDGHGNFQPGQTPP